MILILFEKMTNFQGRCRFFLSLLFFLFPFEIIRTTFPGCIGCKIRRTTILFVPKTCMRGSDVWAKLEKKERNVKCPNFSNLYFLDLKLALNWSKGVGEPVFEIFENSDFDMTIWNFKAIKDCFKTSFLKIPTLLKMGDVVKTVFSRCKSC